MSDLLKKYLDESCCSHCFNIDSECNKCVEKLLAEHDAKVRADAIEECIEIIKDTARRNCSHLLDEIVYRAVEQMENLKEEK